MLNLLLSDSRMCEWESEYDQQEWCCLWVSEVKFLLCILIEKSPPVIAVCNKNIPFRKDA